MAQRACLWPGLAKLANLANLWYFGRFWPVWAGYGLKPAGLRPVFCRILLKIAKNRGFRTRGDTFPSRTENSDTKSPSRPQFSDNVHMGWNKIGFIISTFLHPCIYGRISRSENHPLNRAPRDQPEKGPKPARMTRSKGHF